MRYSFLTAHPDDETFIGMFIRLAVKKGHDVEIVSLTKGEYGTLDAHLKGEKVAAIRVVELQNAVKLYGVPREKVKFLGLIDGNVTLPKAMKVLRTYFQQRKPQVIFAPEYTFSIYVHPDHVNTGKAACLLIKQNVLSPRPLLFTYHSFKNSHYIRTSIFATSRALEKHRSQVQVIVYLYPLFWLYSIFNGFFYCHRFLFAESIRRVFFEKKIRITFLDRLFYAAASFGKFFFKAWSPNRK
jgi:LmbE family N-acetylglucosaminyl deacetylase